MINHSSLLSFLGLLYYIWDIDEYTQVMKAWICDSICIYILYYVYMPTPPRPTVQSPFGSPPWARLTSNCILQIHSSCKRLTSGSWICHAAMFFLIFLGVWDDLFAKQKRSQRGGGVAGDFVLQLQGFSGWWSHFIPDFTIKHGDFTVKHIQPENGIPQASIGYWCFCKIVGRGCSHVPGDITGF